MTFSVLPRLCNSFPRSVITFRGTLTLTIWACTGALVQAQIVNSWTNPGSGAWEDAAKWSLGARPASSQTVAITNAVRSGATDLAGDTAGGAVSVSGDAASGGAAMGDQVKSSTTGLVGSTASGLNSIVSGMLSGF